LDEDEVTEKIAANETERVALARRFGLVSLEALEAEVMLRRVGHGPVVRLEGSLRAKVVQSCVVSLDSIENDIEEDFVLHFAPERRDLPHGHVVEDNDDENGDDLPEPLVDNRIDIGEVVAQQLALALDPYPRRPGVTLEEVLGPLKGATAAGVRSTPSSASRKEAALRAAGVRSTPSSASRKEAALGAAGGAESPFAVLARHPRWKS
ncbi:MAG TPA: DUF177 domain-containing protein, partial [Alphaproteobacteria bacterium]